jgi:Mn2+/Fe2+ NRAMP family transporter
MTIAKLHSPRWQRILVVAGPGLVAILANTDAGSIITIAQSGAKWGYQLLLPNLLFVPFMFMAQELAARLGLGTGRGAADLVLRRLGRGPAIVLLVALAVSCFGGLLTEMSGLAGAGATYGVPIWATMTLTVLGLMFMIATGSYRSVERVGLFLGSFELAFFVMAWNSQPSVMEIVHGATRMSVQNSDYLYLLAANLGTSIIPWTLLYQQSASVDKRLDPGDIKGARIETLAGVVLCQAITSALIVAVGATLGGKGGSLVRVEQIGTAFTATLGSTIGNAVFVLGLVGGALAATIVVCLTLAWTFGEVLGVRHSLEHHPTEAPWFYGVLGAMIVAGAASVSSGINLIDLAVGAGVINALLLPIVLGFLYFLGRTALPEVLCLKGIYAAVVAIAFLLISGVGLYTGLVGAWWSLRAGAGTS